MHASHSQEARSVVIVVGCDDAGSAIAHALHRTGMAVVLTDRADPPWPRRGMAYVDAWYVGGATVEDVDACFCGSVRSLPAVLARGDTIAATTWSWQGAAVALAAEAVVERRTDGGVTAVALETRGREGVTTRSDCNVTLIRPGRDVTVVRSHSVVVASPVAQSHPPHTVQRIDVPCAGRFRTRHQIGERVQAGDVVGEVGSFAAVAATSGVLLALAARGARVAPHQAIVEIDADGDPACCFGIRPEARAFAQRVVAAVRTVMRQARMAASDRYVETAG